MLAVARDHPLAGRAEVRLEDVAEYEVGPMLFGELPELVAATIPEFAPSGRPIRRAERVANSPTEVMSLVASGATVHPTVESFERHFGHPDIVLVPLRGLPPLRSALLWRRHSADPRVASFVATASAVIGRATADATMTAAATNAA